MNQKIQNKIEEVTFNKISKALPVSGGCISETNKIILSNGKEYFIKVNFSSGFFPKEANGLNEIKKANCIRVPEVIYADNDFILLEFINQSSPNKYLFEDFGRKFALMHKFNSEYFGFYEDNFIGSTVQLNIPKEKEKSNWAEFYWNKRLLFQYKLTENNGYADKQLSESFLKLENIFNKILDFSFEKPSLLHGDLWSGNYITDENGEACLIDPAVYYGNREADLAMTKLFGGFDEKFYSAYNETFPLPEGWQYREGIYKLYHLFNHLNLFGNSYYGSVLNTIKYYIN